MKSNRLILILALFTTLSAFADTRSDSFDILSSVFRANIGPLNTCDIKRAHMTGTDGLELYGFYITKGRTRSLVSIFGEGKFNFKNLNENQILATYTYEYKDTDWDSSSTVKNDISVTYTTSDYKINKLVVSETVKRAGLPGRKTTLRCF